MRCVLLLLAAVVCASCGDQPPPRTASATLLAGAPVPPGSARVESAGGAEAVEAVYRTGMPPDAVASWYRRWYLDHAWRITGDTRLADGTFVIHADSAARPLWVMIRPAQGSTTFSIMAAEPGAQ